MTSGEWTGTMCLTEPHCGTDLRLMKTKAVEQPDGTYVFGPDLNKIGAANNGYEKMLAEETEKPIVVQK